MSYASPSDLVARFGEGELIELTDRADPPAGEIDADVVAAALADADALIDSYLGRVCGLPLASVPSRLVSVAAQIARYLLHSTAAPENVRQDYGDALAWLKDVGAGRAVLDIAGAPAAPAGDAVRISGPARVLTAETLRGY